MRKSRTMILTGACLSLLAWAPPGWGVPNNGFESDHLYICRDAAQTGEIRVIDEYSGATIDDDFAPANSDWSSLAFSGSAGSNDARLFVARALPLDAAVSTDIEVAELDSTGATVRSLILSSLTSMGTNLTFGNIRYNRFYPDSVFVAARSDASGQSRGMVWELDLGLSTLKNTYVGPTMPTPGGADTQERPANIAIGDDGTLYMVARHLNSATADSKGDLVKLTGLNSFQVLVDGATMSGTDPRWAGPITPTFRKGDPSRDDGSDTLVITMRPPASTAAAPALELYLNTTLHPADANGNLRVRGSPLTVLLGWNGHQDVVTGGLWMASLRGGAFDIRRNDGIYSLETGRNWSDVDSPPYYGPVPPVLDPAADDTALPNVPYTRQLTLSQGTAPMTWSLTAPDAPGATVSDSGLVSGWTPTKDDAGKLVGFSVTAVNAQGSSSTTWQTQVYRESINGFIPDYVYVSRSSTGDNRIACIRLHRKSDGTEVAVWDPAADPKYKLWTTLTFSGTGRNDDARLFVAQPLNMTDNWHGNDILIAELNANGVTVNSKALGQLIGQSPGSYIDLGNIRYNRYHNTLIVSAHPNGNDANAPAMAWEVDLSLSSLVHTYQGPAAGLGRPVNTAFDERTGKLYMGGRNLGNHTDQGDLVAFDTAGRLVGGTTTTYSLMMDGPARYGPADPHTYWYKPVAPIYRAGSPGRYDGTDTLLDLTGANANGGRAYEVYLDTALHPPAADGLLSTNLDQLVVFRSYLGYNGQQEEPNGDVWVANFRRGFSVLRSDNTFTDFQSGYYWWDIDTPPYQTCNAPGADLDADGDVDQMDFAILQLECIGGTPVRGPLSQNCTCVDLGDENNDGVPDHDGDIDSFDLAVFVNCSSGPMVPADPDCGG